MIRARLANQALHRTLDSAGELCRSAAAGVACAVNEKCQYLSRTGFNGSESATRIASEQPMALASEAHQI
jgi:hypothetical protein